jgi:hypothetical protein
VARRRRRTKSESDEKKEREHWFCVHRQDEYPSFISRHIVHNILKSNIFLEEKSVKTKRLMILAIVLAAVLILPVGAKACLVNFSITVSADDGVSQVNQIFNGSGYTDADGKFVWALGAPTALLGGSLDSLKLTVNSDPEVGVDFGFKSLSSTVTYSISDVVSFSDPLVNPIAYASAGVTLTDKAPLGATITGLFDGGKTYQARYNGSTVFANLVNGFSVSGGTSIASEDAPSVQIIDTLTSIGSEFRFKLSAGDSASGTSNFVVVVPEPATMCLLGLGGLLLRRKK